MPDTFFTVITQAVSDFSENGYLSQDQLDDWMVRIREAAHREMISERDLQDKVRDALTGVYRRMVENGGILRRHPDIGRFTYQRVQPKLRAELDRRIMASANLIRLNRAAAIETTLQRFAGWATSVPAGGSDVVAKRPVKTDIRKAMASLPFRDRRVAIDQGSRFLSNLSNILATEGGALAAKWNHHYVRYPRPDHVERDGKVYLIKDTWAHKKGLVKPNQAGYFDNITKPAEEILCRCTATYLYALRALPSDMLTVKGRDELSRVRNEITRMRAA